MFAGSVTSLDTVYALLNPEGARLEAEAAAARAAELAAEAAAEVAAAQAVQEALAAVEASQTAATGAHEGEGAACDGTASEGAGVEAVAVAETSPEVFPEVFPNVLRDALPDQMPEPEQALVVPLVVGPVDSSERGDSRSRGRSMPWLSIKLWEWPELWSCSTRLTSTSHPTPAVVWGSISEAEALRLLQAGARGILRRTSESGTLLTCLRAVTIGGTWMEDGIFGSTDKLFNPHDALS